MFLQVFPKFLCQFPCVCSVYMCVRGLHNLTWALLSLSVQHYTHISLLPQEWGHKLVPVFSLSHSDFITTILIVEAVWVNRVLLFRSTPLAFVCQTWGSAEVRSLVSNGFQEAVFYQLWPQTLYVSVCVISISVFWWICLTMRNFHNMDFPSQQCQYQ